MLTLSRNTNQTILIGDDITVTVVNAKNKQATLKFQIGGPFDFHSAVVFEATLPARRGALITPRPGIDVTVSDVNEGTVRVSIDAPRDVKIMREEVAVRIAQANEVAAAVAADLKNALSSMSAVAGDLATTN